MIFYRNKNKKILEKIRLLSKEKSNYFKSLSKKKNDGINRLKEQTIGLTIEEIFKLNKLKRDYSYFSSNSSRLDNKITPIKIRFTQVGNYPIKIKKEKDYLNKKNKIKFGKLPNIKNNNCYEFPKSTVPIRYISYLNNNSNKLANAGKEIINKNII